MADLSSMVTTGKWSFKQTNIRSQHWHGIFLLNDITPIDELVLSVIVDHDYALRAEDHKMYRRGISWPSIRLIAEHVKRSVRTVQRSLRRLESLGLIETFIDTTHKYTNAYVVRWDNILGATPVPPVTIHLKNVTTEHLHVVTKMAPKACACAEVRQGSETREGRQADPPHEKIVPVTSNHDKAPFPLLCSRDSLEPAERQATTPPKTPVVNGRAFDETGEKPAYYPQRIALLAYYSRLGDLDDAKQDACFWRDVAWMRKHGRKTDASNMIALRRGTKRVNSLDDVMAYNSL